MKRANPQHIYIWQNPYVLYKDFVADFAVILPQISSFTICSETDLKMCRIPRFPTFFCCMWVKFSKNFQKIQKIYWRQGGKYAVCELTQISLLYMKMKRREQLLISSDSRQELYFPFPLLRFPLLIYWSSLLSWVSEHWWLEKSELNPLNSGSVTVKVWLATNSNLMWFIV